MNKVVNWATALSVAGVLFGMPAVSEAATLTFANPDAPDPATWVYNNADPALQGDWVVVVDDETYTDKWTVNITIDNNFNLTTGDFLAFGFDSALVGLQSNPSASDNSSDLLTLTSITNVSTSPDMSGMTGFYGLGTNSQETCGSGCNFNGVSDPATGSDLAFDYIVRLGLQGSPGGQAVTNATFSIASGGLDLTATNFTQVGLRIQTLGEGGGTGSAKDYNSTPIFTPTGGLPTPVPLPAALWLLIGALSSFGIFGWCKQKLAAT